MDLTGCMTDSLHCRFQVAVSVFVVCGLLVACLAFIYLNWLYAITYFVAIMANSLAGV